MPVRNGVKGKDIVADVKALRKGSWFTSLKSTTSAELRAILAYDLLGINDLKYVFGLGTGPRRKAVIRGELHLSNDSAGAFLKKGMRYVKKGVIAPFVTLGFFQNGKIVRDPAFPDLPTVGEAYEKLNGKKPSGVKWKAMTHLFHMGVTASKAFALPPKTPDEILNTWVATAKKITSDKKFKKKAKKALGAYPHSYGEEARKIIESTVGVDPKTKKWMKKWIKEKFKAAT